MPVNPSLRLCSTLWPPLGPLQENMHPLKPEPSTTIEKCMHQMPTAEFAAHWFILYSNSNHWYHSSLLKRVDWSKATAWIAPVLLGSLEMKITWYSPPRSPHLGALSDSLTPLPWQESLYSLCLPRILSKTFSNTSDHVLLKLFVCILLESGNSGFLISKALTPYMDSSE